MLCEWLFEVPFNESKRSVKESGLSEIPQITFSDFEQGEMAVEIYSEVLECSVWFCSNEEMATQVKDEAPGVVSYTASELRLLLMLKPRPDDLKAIHEVKVMNSGSVIKEVVINEDNKTRG